MITTELQIEERLTSKQNIIHKGFSRNQNPTGYQPEFLREIEAGLVIQGEQGKDVAKVFNTTPQTVSNYNNGRNLSEDGQKRIEERKGKARDAALDALVDTLGLIKEDDIKKVSVKDRSIIASNLSKVVEKMDSRGNVSNHNTLVIYAPQQKSEASYESITI